MNLMSKERLIAFTDAVLAIIMTILVLELERPNQISWQALWDLRTNFFAYTISSGWEPCGLICIVVGMWLIKSTPIWFGVRLSYSSFHPFSPTPQTWFRLILTIQLLNPSMGTLFFW